MPSWWQGRIRVELAVGGLAQVERVHAGVGVRQPESVEVVDLPFVSLEIGLEKMWNFITRAEFNSSVVEWRNRVPHGLPIHMQLVVNFDDLLQVDIEAQIWLVNLGMNVAKKKANAHHRQYPDEEAGTMGSGM